MVPPAPGRLFYEEQPLRVRRLRWRLAMLPLFVTVLAVLQVGFGRHWGTYPVSNGNLIVLAVLMWIVFAWLVRVRLVIEVTGDAVSMRLRGLFRRHRVAIDRCRSSSVVSFDPMRDFGGIGARRRGRTRAYLAGGTTGVRIDLDDGDAVVIDTERPADLLAAVQGAVRRRSA